MERSLAFYRERLGLEAAGDGKGKAVLSAGDRALIVLWHKPGARPKPRNTSGLYHYAILVPGRAELGRALQMLLDVDYPLQGASDHLVSEAVYLADPDGNGIEIYRDRPREQWPHRDGELQMATDPLDVEGVLASAGSIGSGPALPAGTKIGHVHLHVSDLAAAEQFYGDVVGFELMTRYGRQASFLSAGGYHHHLGINVWAGVGAPRPPTDAAGLRRYTVMLEKASDLGELVDRLHRNDIEVEESSGSLDVKDPSGNSVRFVLGSAAEAALKD